MENLSPHQVKMATAPLGKLILFSSLPTMFGMLINSLYSVIDRFWVARIPGLGDLGNASVGICLPVMNIINAFDMLFAIGGAVCISISLGQKDFKRAEKILGSGFLMAIIANILFSVVALIFSRQILHAFGASNEVMPYATQFFDIIVGGSVFLMVYLYLSHIIRSTGNTLQFAKYQLIGAVINILLDPVFIYVFHLKIEGIAIATILSQTIAMLAVLYYYLLGKKNQLKLRLTHFRIDFGIFKIISSLGFAPFISNALSSIVVIVLNNSLEHYGNLQFGSGGGDMAVAIGSVCISVMGIFQMPMWGINQGSQPIIGFNHGARNEQRVRSSFFWVLLYMVILCAMATVFFEVFAGAVVSLFSNDPKSILFGASYFRIIMSTFVLQGVFIAIANFYQAIGSGRVTSVLWLLRQVVLLIPLYLTLPLVFHLNGILFAQPLSDIICSMLGAALIYITFFSKNPSFRYSCSN